MHDDPAKLLRAMKEGEFFPVFQPIVELRTGQLIGLEMLARWRDARGGEIPPEAFIPRVEAAGLIGRMTELLLGEAFAATELRESGLQLAVNLSPVQLHDAGLPEMIAGCAARGGFALNRLMLEVTESALLENPGRAKAVAQELKGLGCRLALDDFGTGYSSLRHLEALPFDQLKVDRSFVLSMGEARESRKIVAAVVGLGQSLGLVTVAEGVEQPAAARMLLWLGCDLAQGWLYGRPAPAAEIPQMLKRPRQTFVLPPSPAEEGLLLNMGLEALPAQRLGQIQAIYDGTPVGLCLLDRNMRYVSLNRRLAEINGAPLLAHLGKTVAEVIPRLFPLIEPYIRRALAGESVLGVEVRKPGPEGQTVLLSYHPARDEAGEVLGVSVAVMDVTEHKRTQEALEESMSHFRHLLKLGPHVPWVLDGEGQVVEASPKWEEVTGQSLAEAMGTGWLKMLHPDDLERAREAVRLALSVGEAIDVYFRVHARDGSWMPMRSRGAVRFDAAGKIIGVYGVLEEISGQKEDGAGGRADLQSCGAQ